MNMKNIVMAGEMNMNKKITVKFTPEEFSLIEIALIKTRHQFQDYNSCYYLYSKFGRSPKLSNLCRLYTNLIIKVGRIRRKEMD